VLKRFKRQLGSPFGSSRAPRRDCPAEFLRHFSQVPLPLPQFDDGVAAASPGSWTVGGFDFDYLDSYLIACLKLSLLKPAYVFCLRADEPADRDLEHVSTAHGYAVHNRTEDTVLANTSDAEFPAIQV
jgi:hypothetical protein